MNKECEDCTIGYMNFGFHPYLMTSRQYINFIRQDPVVGEKYFIKFNFCPFCGRKIEWDLEV